MNSESNSVEALRDTAGKGMLILLWLHLPLSLAISLARGMDWIMPLSLMAVLAIAATLSWRVSGNGVSTRCTVAVALMGGVSLLVYQMSGHPWQIDMHMYFFATLACLAAYCDFRPILIGAGAVALHHLTLNFLYPAAVYPGGADFTRVVVHAVILVFEAAILVWLPYKLAQMFDVMAEKSAEAEAAKAAQQQATAERTEAEHQAKQERDAARRELADSFEQTIGQIVAAVAVAAGEMRGTSSTMDATAGEEARKAGIVAAASTQSAENVASVASATDQLTSSIGEIGQQVQRSSNIAGKASEQARRTSAVVGALVAGTQKIGEVVALIQIHAIQNATDEAVGAIQAIDATIAEINQISSAIATSVEQQGAATREIAGSVRQAAHSSQDVNANITDVTAAATNVGQAADQVMQAAVGLSSQSEKLKAEVNGFVSSIRAA